MYNRCKIETSTTELKMNVKFQNEPNLEFTVRVTKILNQKLNNPAHFHTEENVENSFKNHLKPLSIACNQ